MVVLHQIFAYHRKHLGSFYLSGVHWFGLQKTCFPDISFLWYPLRSSSTSKLTSPNTSQIFFMITLSLLLLIEERALLTTLIDKWLLSTSAKHCLVDRPVKWSFKVRILQLNVIILHSASLSPEYNNWQLL